MQVTDLDDASRPAVVDRATWQARLERLRVQEKAYSRAGDALAAERRRLPMVEVDASIPVVGPDGAVPLIEVFEGRRQLIAYYFMWGDGAVAADQCEGCTWFTGQVRELTPLHSRDITFAVFAQGPYPESRRYRDFLGWEMPWYAVGAVMTDLLPGRRAGMMHLCCYLRDGDQVFETYATTLRGVEVMSNAYPLMDLTVYGRQEDFEDSPDGWPQRWGAREHPFRSEGRPMAHWPALAASRSDDLSRDTDPPRR